MGRDRHSGHTRLKSPRRPALNRALDRPSASPYTIPMAAPTIRFLLGLVRPTAGRLRMLGVEVPRRLADVIGTVYIEFVDWLMSAKPEPPGGWLDGGEYDLRAFGSPEQMEDAEAGLSLEAGSQTLDGSTALALARARKEVGDGSDTNRLGRQQQLLARRAQTERTATHRTRSRRGDRS